MMIRPAEILEGGLTAAAVSACVQEFMQDAPRRQRLKNYYEGRAAILDRNRASGLPNNRLVHGFARYICTVAAGYLVGRAVTYEAEEGQKAPLEAVMAEYARCSADSIDIELARKAAVYGRAVERVFADGQARPRMAALEPDCAFVVYDDSVEHRPLFGVHLQPRLKKDGSEDGWTVEVCTDSEVIRYRASGVTMPDKPESREAHFFGAVPMVEYWNNEEERGDFEGVVSLIDAYDALQSDRVNDKQQFVDALLLLAGCTMESDDGGRTPAQQLREDKVLVLPDADARAEWLCKQLNEADTEVLRRALAEDIHKLSMVPDLSDEHFAGVTSGVAMRYKLLGLEQLTRVKERWFREALRMRLKLFGAFLAVRGGKELDAAAVKMVFSRALPVNELEQAQTIRALHGVVEDGELARRAERMKD